MPTASIIITTHNRPHVLPRAIESARESGKDVEIVVVDDASSDQTADICKTISNINYVRVERNQGVAGARNIGLVASSGEYVSFLDDDDTRLPGSLDQQLSILKSEPQAGLIYGQAFYGDQEGNPTDRFYPADCPHGDLFWQLLSRNFIPCGTAVFRRSCLSRVGLLDDSIAGLDDWDLWVRIGEVYSIIALESPVIIWRRSTPASGQGTSNAAQIVSLSVRQFRRWMNLPRAQSASRHTKRTLWHAFSENMAEHLIWESARALRSAQVGQAVKSLATLPRLHPLTIIDIARHRAFAKSTRKALGIVRVA
ncbi:MAG TPA: glycosyltransferase [Pyrinomonadaceae bacterium]|nr:glycosyltransferase [Pyrinomonadaceae bacterium]